MEPQRIVQAVLALYSVDQKSVSSALGVHLPPFRDNPFWVFFRAENVGVFSYVHLALSKTAPTWRVSFRYSLDHCNYLESSVDFSVYGPVVRADLNPDIRPEGAWINVYHYSGYKLSFEIAPKSRRILGGTVEFP